MINYLSSNLSVSIYQFSVDEINAGSKSYVWNGNPIIFVAWFNYLDNNFTNLDVYDNAGLHITRQISLNSNCYSIAFSGKSGGSPLNNNLINDLNSIQFNFGIGPVTSGYLIAKVYYI
jgi:hypothetical protein